MCMDTIWCVHQPYYHCQRRLLAALHSSFLLDACPSQVHCLSVSNLPSLGLTVAIVKQYCLLVTLALFPGAEEGEEKELSPTSSMPGNDANVTIPSANVILHVQCAYMKKCNDKSMQWVTGMTVCSGDNLLVTWK